MGLPSRCVCVCVCAGGRMVYQFIQIALRKCNGMLVLKDIYFP